MQTVMISVLVLMGLVLAVCVIGLCVISGKMLLGIAKMMDEIAGRHNGD